MIRIKKVKFINYKVLRNFEMEFDKNKNPFWLSKPNEYGKSTLLEGIVDAFKFDPKVLKGKRSKGAEEDPVVELVLEIDGNEFSILVSAQEDKVELRGKDVVRTEKNKIEEFFAEKGYPFISSVVERLLWVKERDMSTDVSGGLERLVDDVLKTKRLKEVEETLTGVVARRGRRLFKGELGKREEELRKEKESLMREHQELRESLDSYHKNLEKMKMLKKEVEFLESDIEKKQKALDDLEVKLKVAEKMNKESRLEKLKKEKEELEQKIAFLESKVKRLKAEIAEIERKMGDLQRRKEKLIARSARISDVERRLESLKSLRSIAANMGKFHSVSTTELTDILSKVRTLEEVSAGKGVIEVVEAKEPLFIDGDRVAPRERREFEQASIEYPGLHLKIYASKARAQLERLKREVKERFGGIDVLERLVSLAKERDKLLSLCSIEDGKDMDILLKKTEKELESLKNVKSELESLSKNISELESKKKETEKKLLETERKTAACKASLEAKGKEIAFLEEDIIKFEEEMNIPYSLVRRIERELGEGVTLDAIREEKEKTASEVEKAKKKLAKLREELARLEGLTNSAPNEARIKEIAERIEKIDATLSKMERLRKVIDASLTVLPAMKGEIERMYKSQLEEHVAELMRRITGRYNEVRTSLPSLFFKGKEFSKAWETSLSEGGSFRITELSDGTKTQLLLAARIALIRLFVEKPMLLLLDEPFAYFDAERREKTLEILNQLANEGWQIIGVSAR